MTPSEQAKAAGFKSLAEVARKIGKPRRTLYNWHRDSPELFGQIVNPETQNLKDLISHMVVHDGYKLNGFKHMTTEQKELYGSCVGRTVDELWVSYRYETPQ